MSSMPVTTMLYSYVDRASQCLGLDGVTTYGLQHFPFPPFIGLHPCCPVHNIHGLFTLGCTMQEKYIYRIPYSYHGQLFAVAQAISWFRVSRVSKHCYIFFLSCINFSNNNKPHVRFFPSISLIISVKGGFRGIFLTAIFWKIISGKGQEEGKGTTMLMPKTCVTDELN